VPAIAIVKQDDVSERLQLHFCSFFSVFLLLFLLFPSPRVSADPLPLDLRLPDLPACDSVIHQIHRTQTSLPTSAQ
jgi:hypothetical protein